MPNCVACDAPLDQRFCARCGKDNGSQPETNAISAPVPSQPVGPSFASPTPQPPQPPQPPPYGNWPPPAPATRHSSTATKRSSAPWVIAGIAGAVGLIGIGVLGGWAIGRTGSADNEATPAVEADDGAGEDSQNAETLSPIVESDEPVELESIEDDTGVIRADVPVVWADRDLIELSPGEPSILVSDDIDGYFRSYDVAGVSITGFEAGSVVADRYFDPSDQVQMDDFLWFVARFANDRGDIPMNACADVDNLDFAEGGVHGVMDVYTGCGEEGTEFVAIAAADEPERVGAFVELIVTNGDEKAAVDTILRSIEVEFLN